jgi:uncharacterized membrane protein YphA (DoxX/SURF4 family)
MKMNQLHLNSAYVYLQVVLRVIIGRHFLYEGVMKLLSPG